MRIVSTFPSATEIVCTLGFADALVGVSHQCMWPAEVRDLPRVTRSVLVGGEAPAEISAKMRDRRAAGQCDPRIVCPGFALDEQALAELEPEFMTVREPFTPGGSGLAGPVRPLTFTAATRTLHDVVTNVRNVARDLGAPERGERLARQIEARIDAVRRLVAGRPRPRVLSVEWMDPVKIAGGWMPELIEVAGGTPLLNPPGRPAREVDWRQVIEAAPELLIVKCCGWSLAETARQMRYLTRRPGWDELPAVRSGRVYLLDGRVCSRSGPRVTTIAELLARLLHPDALPGDLVSPGQHFDEELPQLSMQWDAVQAVRSTHLPAD